MAINNNNAPQGSKDKVALLIFLMLLKTYFSSPLKVYASLLV